jgi:hypothetical protein
MHKYISLTALLLCSACVMPNGPGQRPIMNAFSAPVAPTVSVTMRTNLRSGWRLEVMRLMPSQEFQACSIVRESAGASLGVIQTANGEQILRVMTASPEAKPSSTGSVSIDGNQRVMAMTKMARVGMAGEAAGDEWRTAPLPKADFLDQFRLGRSMTVTIEGQSAITVSLDGSNDAAGALANCAVSRGAASQPVVSAAPRQPVVSAAPRSAVTTAPQKPAPGKPTSNSDDIVRSKRAESDEVWDAPQPVTKGQAGVVTKPVAGKADEPGEKWD